MLRELLVDDEHLYFGKELIDWKNEGFEIVGSAADGEEALLFWSTGCNLILADIKMPIMDGLEFVRKLRISLKNIEIFILLF